MRIPHCLLHENALSPHPSLSASLSSPLFLALAVFHPVLCICSVSPFCVRPSTCSFVHFLLTLPSLPFFRHFFLSYPLYLPFFIFCSRSHHLPPFSLPLGLCFSSSIATSLLHMYNSIAFIYKTRASLSLERVNCADRSSLPLFFLRHLVAPVEKAAVTRFQPSFP